MRSLLLTLCIVSLFIVTHGHSHSDPNMWINAKKCKVKTGAEGRCVPIDYCSWGREDFNNPKCGTGQNSDLCCEARPEDFVVNNYGHVAKQNCLKYMNNIDWKKYGYVFGGINARAKEFTFMAALGYGPNVSNIKFQCGGSLISEKHVLTAAHCLFSQDDGPVRYVLLGDLDINDSKDDAQPQYLYVQNVSIYPQYKRSSSYHDIAILHLDRPVNFTEYVQPACLDFGQLPIVVNSTKLYATGWGYIDTNQNKASHMQEVALVEYAFEKCHKTYPMNRRKLTMGIVDTQLCAAGATERKDTCQGDSGGPLSIRNSDIRFERYKGYIVVGITSFGKLCGYTNAPGVYTRVEKYIPWIESVVWPEDLNAMNINSQHVAPQILSQQGDSKPNPVISNNYGNQTNVGTVVIPQVQVEGLSTLPENKDQVLVQVTVAVQVPHTVSPIQTIVSTRKPTNLIDVHYFSDKK